MSLSAKIAKSSRWTPMGGDPTSSSIALSRRAFLRRLGLGVAGFHAASCADRGTKNDPPKATPAFSWPQDFSISGSRDDLPPDLPHHGLTPREIAAGHNNFYEFLPGRAADLSRLVSDFVVKPWTLRVGGACHKPQELSLDDLLAFPHEERLYHFRCVERWSMNIPWTGFPLAALLEKVEPKSSATWVRFESALDRETMPGVERTPFYPWPYREALRLDEALHDLTLLATGVYGEPLPKQHGAPIRLVVPWKYGYKSAKSLVSIELLEEAPTTFWHEVSAHEYGLLSNVTPYIPHPRWGQHISFWLRDDPVWPTGKDVFKTQIFNGYEEQVGALYPDEPRTHRHPLRPGDIAR